MKLLSCVASVFVLALFPLLTGCQSSKVTAIAGVATLPPTNPASVEIIDVTPTRNFRVLGVVKLTKMVGSFEAKQSTGRRFQEQAAKLGAQAVIIDVMPSTSLSGAVTTGEGRAIVWESKPRE